MEDGYLGDLTDILFFLNDYHGGKCKMGQNMFCCISEDIQDSLGLVSSLFTRPYSDVLYIMIEIQYDLNITEYYY